MRAPEHITYAPSTGAVYIIILCIGYSHFPVLSQPITTICGAKQVEIFMS